MYIEVNTNVIDCTVVPILDAFPIGIYYVIAYYNIIIKLQ